ncbi:alpha/beta hydrolase [Acetobacteraceae bacterium H6797]|nr:alpha/beta hydrolase [Acetobacteraceae bacterium H6797]
MQAPTPRFGAYRCPIGLGVAVLRWVEWGPADGPIVICVHGLTRTGRDFDPLAQALAAQGHRVICPDIFGRGMSDWLPDGALYVVPAYVSALLPFLAELGRPYDWVGTSMGGLIGMGLCAVPGTGMRRLVLNDVGPFIPASALNAIGHYLGQETTFADVTALETHLRHIHAGFGPMSDEQWRHLAETSARMTADGQVVQHYDPAIAFPMQGVPLADVDLWAIWPACTHRPIQAIRGEHSGLLNAETAARMAEHPMVRLATIPDCGHAPSLMQGSQIALVAEFLAAAF